MAGPKTSAEKSREDEKNAAADDMFGGAFGGLQEMEVTETAPVEESESHSEDTEEIEVAESSETEESTEKKEPEMVASQGSSNVEDDFDKLFNS